jgi:hypothetical protein
VTTQGNCKKPKSTNPDPSGQRNGTKFNIKCLFTKKGNKIKVLTFTGVKSAPAVLDYGERLMGFCFG